MRKLVLLLLCASSVSAADRNDIRELKEHALRVVPHAQTAAPKTIDVDCTKGQKIQEAVDKNAAPLDIAVHGVCAESVQVNGKDINLHGTDPLTDRVEGGSGSGLILININSAIVSNLGFTNSSLAGVAVFTSAVEMTNCRMSGNFNGIAVRDDSTFVGHGLTIASNTRGITADNARFAGCIGCRAENNTSWAAVSARGSVVSYLDSEVIGTRGLLASGGGYADIDCITENTTHPCSMQVTTNGLAAAATAGGSTTLYGSGDFTGRVTANDRGSLVLYGARQTASGTNSLDGFATLDVQENVDVIPSEPSQLRGVQVNSFSRVLIREGTTLAANIQCTAAGDAWVDPATTVSPGVTVTGCDHASIP
jgi:hypothetical protein